MTSPQKDTCALPRWATKEQAAQHVGVSVKTILRWAEQGLITAYRAGPRLIRYNLNELDAALTTTGGQEERSAAHPHA